MNKHFSVFFAAAALSATATLALAAFLFSPLMAKAYVVGSTGSSTESNAPAPQNGSYDFGSSFQNLVSPFTNFFNNIKNTGGNTFSVGGGSTAPGVMINVNTQPYVNEFDAWFYGFTGVHIEKLTGAITSFFGWLFGALGSLVPSIANFIKGIIH